MIRRTIPWVLALALGGPHAAAAEETSLATVLQRAADYVADFQHRLSGIVAEEHYVQHVLASTKRRGCPGNAADASVRNCEGLASPVESALRSDLLLVRPVGATRWAEFRDVFEVDGAPVRDRAERLTKLFLGDDAPAARERIGQILDESSRFNIGDIARNINTPLFAMQVLESANQPRFSFKRTRNGIPATFSSDSAPSGAFRIATEVWIIEYHETQHGTMIRTGQLKDLPARGRFWIEPSTGRVLMSELIASNRSISATVDVSYQSEPLIGLLVPIEMREHYQSRRGARIEAVATYGRFRQFQVNVNEQFLLKK
jgi:hypothetical protein